MNRGLTLPALLAASMALAVPAIAGTPAPASHGQPTAQVSHAFDQPTASVVEGEGGVPLVVQEWGNPKGVPVLLLHGFGFSSVVFKNQIGDIARHVHFIAFDLRGHGLSGKPWRPQDYAGWKVWAKDVAAVIASKKLDRPVIVGWSFGGFVAIDYLRLCGSHCARGLVLVSSLGGLVTNPPEPDPAKYGMPPQRGNLRSDNYHQLFEGIDWTTRVMTAHPPPPAIKRMEELSMAMSPPYAKRAMMGIRLDNEDLPGKLALPVLLMNGSQDGSITVAKEHELKGKLPDARVITFQGMGHAMFLEDPALFNRDLLHFVEQVGGGAGSTSTAKAASHGTNGAG